MKKYIFVSDYFKHQTVGGAEFTTDAIMCHGVKIGVPIVGINCTSLNLDLLKSASKEDYHFIVCNFKSLEDELKIYMCKNLSYSIIEYDYKLCEYRSFEIHELVEGQPCDCVERPYGKLNTAFYAYAEKVWFMSENQKNSILSKTNLLKDEKCEVLSSVFDSGDLRFIKSISDNEKNENYLILNSPSPIKGTDNCIAYAEEHNLQYELIKDLSYHELLIKLSTSKGLIFLPAASDTCPRLVIEAKLFGCDLILNNHVQHKDEPWFETAEKCWKHLETRQQTFWDYYER